ncbi:hypothetical protein ACFUJR_39010, partial [Streptomyces sp. NPDC057271]|uniref:hypothetical protein n=1 Tax=Streptomyces sp. NPDC057271 TaxID=3346078 RepID=UPI003631003E
APVPEPLTSGATVPEVLTHLIHFTLSLAVDGIVLEPWQIADRLFGPDHIPIPNEDQYFYGLIQAAALPHRPPGNTRNLADAQLMGRFIDAVNNTGTPTQDVNKPQLLRALLGGRPPTREMVAQAQGWLHAMELPRTTGLPTALITAARHLAAINNDPGTAVEVIGAYLLASPQTSDSQTITISTWLSPHQPAPEQQTWRSHRKRSSEYANIPDEISSASRPRPTTKRLRQEDTHTPR